MRRRRCRAEIVEAEQAQASVIAELMLHGADNVAAQVTRCWRDRLFGDPTRHEFRCRSVSCLFCRNRASLSAWSRAHRRWSQARGASSSFTLPVEDCLTELPAIAKSLRNLRDRLARDRSWLFADVGFVGLTDGERHHVVASHPRLSRGQVQDRLRALWPGLVLVDVPVEPVFAMSPKTLAHVGSLQRGLQPLRFSISPRAC